MNKTGSKKQSCYKKQFFSKKRLKHVFFTNYTVFFVFCFFHFRRLIGKKQAREKHFSYLKV